MLKFSSVSAIVIAACGLLAAQPLAIVKIEPVCEQTGKCDAVKPGLKVKVTVGADSPADQEMVLFVDGKAMTGVTSTLKKGSKEAVFQIDGKSTESVLAQRGAHNVAMGPAAGPPWAPSQPLIFEPRPPAGVASYYVKRWDSKPDGVDNCADRAASRNLPEPCWARLGDRIVLVLSEGAMATFKDSDEIVMWLDSSPMPGVKAMRLGHDGETKKLVFDWDENLPSQTDSKASWMRILRHPWEKERFTISAGTLAGPPLPSGIADFHIRRLNWNWMKVWGVFFVITAGLLFYLAKYTALLREDQGSTPIVNDRAYSLARTQMAAWMFVVAMALCYIWMVTWNEDVLNARVLVLIGIATGTTLGALIVDDSKKDQAVKTLAVNSAPPTPVAGAVESIEVVDARSILGTPKNDHFLWDLISDRNGPSVARVQMLLFSLILMVIFIVETARTLAMPEFSDTLLGLMGISSSGYLALKLPERKM